MKLLSTLCCGLFFTSPLFAEGLSRNSKGELKSPHTDVRLTESQKEELEALHTVTFTKEQWEELRNIARNTPRRLEHIYPVTYADCVCDMDDDHYGVLQKNGDVAVFHTNAQSSQDFFYKFNYAEHLTFHVDSRGQFHLNGTLVKFPVLLQAIRESGTNLTEEQKKMRANPYTPSASIYTPVGAALDDAAYADRIAILKRELSAKGWQCSGPYPPNQ